MAEIDADIVVVGGSLGGVAATLAGCRRGHRVVLIEETNWLGGQLTTQAVPPDEHPWIEQFGCTRSYRALRHGIREYYRDWYPLTASARDWRELNPGGGRVSKLCHEPRSALAVIEALLAPHRASGRLTVLYEHHAVAAHVDGDLVQAVEVTDRAHERTVVTAPYFLDATDTGDLLPLAKVEYATGAEASQEYAEPHAPTVAQPTNMQGFTVCFAVSHHNGEDHSIDRPQQYDFWRDYQPAFWPGRLLSLLAPDPRTLEPVRRTLEPNPNDEPRWSIADQSRNQGDKELWTFRRILARQNLQQGRVDSDITLVNWPMNDYWLGNTVDVPEETASGHVEAARQLSLSLLYWLQTEAPNTKGGTGYPGLRLRPDVTGTHDGLAKTPYVREGRRIRAQRTVTENDLARDVVGARGGSRYADSVGIGSYRIDLHPSTGGNNYIDVASVPFEIPLPALLPVRVRNLLPACKNAGTTHVTNGCFRLHPVEWNVGEASALLSSFCIEQQVDPHQVWQRFHLSDEFGRLLDREGVERHWPDVRGY